MPNICVCLCVCLFVRVHICGVEDGGGVDDQGQPLWGGHGAHTPQTGKN
jgi:hypothetical protein